VDGDAVPASHVPAGEAPEGVGLSFETRNSDRSDPGAFDEHHVYVSDGAALAAAERGVDLVGIDDLSVDRSGDEAYPAHRALLGSGVLILEGIDLARVAPGRYVLVALPLKIAAGDGSPVHQQAPCSSRRRARRLLVDEREERAMTALLVHEDAVRLGVAHPVACLIGNVGVQPDGADALRDEVGAPAPTTSGRRAPCPAALRPSGPGPTCRASSWASARPGCTSPARSTPGCGPP
jgi:hypothetical protein